MLASLTTGRQMLKQYIKSYKDFPHAGIDFKDTASLCASPEGFSLANNKMYSQLLKYCPVDKIVGLDARGFIFASVFAHRTRGPLVLARKAGKLPGPTTRKDFELEYASASLEIQSDAISKDNKVIIIDDLMATGGTMNAAIDIVQELGGQVVACACIIDLSFLPGGDSIRNRNIPYYTATTY